MAAPSGLAIGLIVGMGVSTWAAILATVGFYARRFMSQQASNHKTSVETLQMVQEFERQLPRIAKRVKRLERQNKIHDDTHGRLLDMIELARKGHRR